jgi:hypothetical protein
MYLMDDCPAFVEISGKRRSHVRREDVHELSKSQRDAIFSEAFSSINAKSAATDAMLERLRKPFPSAASMFDNRARRIGDFAFRLISRPNGLLAVECPSYVALSYH